MKGVTVDSLPEAVRRGLAVHLLIDRMTDSHPLFKSAAACFSEQRLPYAGVLADISLDYALASRWEQFSSLEWDYFKERV
ncbi:MAG: DUF479 domain-containing protein, partial [candidate division Zixibacteria bacterium]|nr:DUF479 domain-containing protein [candidate division Zixibacteria bacterium]NIX54362.1 DUF479 domain-containing protein [candidate division Zixibacteria bacterium]